MSSLNDRLSQLRTAEPGEQQTYHVGRFAGRAHLFVMTLLFSAALAIGWSILPGEDERIEALERDGQTTRAMELLEARFSRGDHRQRTLVQLQRFYERFGETEKLRRVLELLSQQKPRDLYIHRQLAKLYRHMQDEPAEIGALKAQLALRYSEPVCYRLIGLLRYNGDFDAEQTMLRTCRAAGYRRPEELIRLAFLTAADGKTAESAQILSAVDDRRWLGGSRERLLLFETLLESQRGEDALRRSSRWLKGQRDEEFALELISRFVEARRTDLALQLARDVGQPGDAVSLAVGEVLIEQSQPQAALSFLRGWLEEAGPQTDLVSGEVASRFVEAAIDAGDGGLALRAAERHGLEKFNQPELVALAEALAAEGNAQGFDAVRRLLTPAALAGNALILAATDLREGRIDIARLTLGRVRTETLDERRFAHYERIVAQIGRPRSTGVTLREPIRAPAAVPPADVVSQPPEQQARKAASRPEVSTRFSLKKRKRLDAKPARPLPSKSSTKAPLFKPFKFPNE